MAGTILSILLWVLQILTYALIGRALLSWFDPGMQWSISRILADVTEPVIAPIRRVVPPFGTLYGLPTLLDAALRPDSLIAFEAHTHVEAVRLRCRDFERLERPQRLAFSVPESH